jgi:glycerol-3-phosphate cytidylyltransferase
MSLQALSDTILSLDEVVKQTRALRKTGYEIAFTSGCFDLFHAGHAHLIDSIYRGGRILVVGVNGDETVRRLKGDDRPYHSAKLRAQIIASLAGVDYVTIFEESIPETVLAAIKPDLYFKGSDYTIDDLPEADLIRSWGGSIRFIPRLPDCSTTDTIRKILNGRSR